MKPQPDLFHTTPPPRTDAPFDIRARFLIGRPGMALKQVSDFDELTEVLRFGCAAYERAACPSPWPFWVVSLRHDGRWAEQLAQVEIGKMPAGDDHVTFVAAEIVATMEMMRECNAVRLTDVPA